jgi:hypothetical protein
LKDFLEARQIPVRQTGFGAQRKNWG